RTEAERRLEVDKKFYKDTMPDVEILDFGAQETSKIKERIGNSQINAVVSFFSMTFFSKNEKMMEGLLNTISLVDEGGYFIGAVMDGVRVADLLESERKKRSRSIILIKQEIIKINDRLTELSEGNIELLRERLMKLEKRLSNVLTEKEKNKLQRKLENEELSEKDREKIEKILASAFDEKEKDKLI